MIYEIQWSTLALKDAQRLPKQDRRKIYQEVDQLIDTDRWRNVKKLTKHRYQYRLRVGDYRVLFDTQREIKILKIQEIKRRDSQTY